MDKTLKQSTKQQLDKLIGLMENNPDLARGKPQFGSNKKLVSESWESFAVQLNSLGPPSRTGNEWSRVWTHYKANLKRKLAANKQNFLATGGGPSQEVSLNPNEQRVMELISLNTAVRPIGNSFGVDNNESLPIDFDEAEKDTSTVLVDLTSTPLEGRTGRKRKCEEKRQDKLKEILNNQKQLLAVFEDMKETNLKLLKIKEKKFELYEKEVNQKMLLRELKMQYQREKLALISLD